LGFADLGVPPRIVTVLAARGIIQPFPIQAATLPDSLAGRHVLGRGRTGSGKTVAFAVPMVTALSTSGRRRSTGAPRALVLVPTRELAVQVAETVTPIAASLGLTTMTIFGGVGQAPQVSKLRQGTDIVIATPGRLEDLIEQRHCRLSEIEVTVLDEADHMADLGFLPAVQRILDLTPGNAQRLLFSATLDNAVDRLVKRYLRKPVTHSVDEATSAVPEMKHHLFNVTKENKAAVVQQLVSGRGRTLAFTRTKHAAKKLAKQLTAAGIPAADLHGNLSQANRQRNLAAFGEGSTRVLVATDIAARGIHVDDIALVVHVDPPAEHKAYLHRSGRTARAGAEGIVVTIGTPEQRSDVRQLMRAAAIRPETVDVGPGHPAIEILTGPPADHVEPGPTPAPVASGPRGGGRSSASRSSRPSGGRSGAGRSGAGRSDSGRSDSGRSSSPRSGSARSGSGGSGGSDSGNRPGRSRNAGASSGSTGGVAGFSSQRRRGSR